MTAAAAIANAYGRNAELAANTSLSTSSGSNPRAFGIAITSGLGVGGRLIYTMSTTDPSGTGEEEWLYDGAPAGYEAKVTVNSGTLDSGDATGSWVSLDVARTWGKSSVGTVSLTVEIGLRGLSTAIRTHTVTL